MGSTDGGRPPIYKVIGLVLAISSGLFIGTSFVLKKMGLLKANVKYNEEAGEGYGYLKNAWWWTGMTLMIIGEICNFVAYAFTDAILVTPLGALSVVITTILSAIFLKERLSFVGKVGCFMCIIGSVIIVINVPPQSAVSDIQEMKNYVISPGFLSYAGVIIVGSVFIALWAGPKYGKKSMLVYLSICSLVGGLSVVATQGLGSAVVKQASGTPQFNQWFLYVLLVFVICTLLTEIIYLNKALNIFNAALVTPTYYVYFTSSTIVSSAILFRGFHGSAAAIATVVMGFLQICAGVVLLQLSKSAKDVPDVAVFKGELDQVRTVAEQEDPESEPKADTIRGTAALLRSFSKPRQQREAQEVKRIEEERMEPIAENEQVEWQGLRRRKTVYEPGTEPSNRRKTIHPPLGLTYFPESDESGTDDDQQGYLPNLRRRALSVLSRGSIGSGGGGGGGGGSPSIGTPGKRKPPHRHTVALSDLTSAAAPQPPPAYPEFTMPFPPAPTTMPADTAYHGASRPRGESSLHWADTDGVSSAQSIGPGSTARAPSSLPSITPGSIARPASSTSSVGPAPTPPPHTSRRQFSFQQPFARNRTRSAPSSEGPVAEEEDDGDHDHDHDGDHDGDFDLVAPPSLSRPSTSRTGSGNRPSTSRTGSANRIRGNQAGTEEERLGLVVGDSAGSQQRQQSRGRGAGDSAGAFGGGRFSGSSAEDADDEDFQPRREKSGFI